LFHLWVLTNRKTSLEDLFEVILSIGHTYQAGSTPEELMDSTHNIMPDAVLLDLEHTNHSRARLLVTYCQKLAVPVLVVGSIAALSEYDHSLDADDFVVRPVHPDELTFRLTRMLYKVKGNSDRPLVRVGELVIDLEKYEVTVAGRKVLLTYKEYQLLVLLASNPGRVYTRETLLSQLWGYDYFGGTRTVDVHIRRLRSKIEGSGQALIETIRNVGYRFKIVT
jgi:DNA-binding response OmpR family regulator